MDTFKPDNEFVNQMVNSRMGALEFQKKLIKLRGKEDIARALSHIRLALSEENMADPEKVERLMKDIEEKTLKAFENM